MAGNVRGTKIVVPEGKTYRYNGKPWPAGSCFYVPTCIAHMFTHENKCDTVKDACFPERKCGPHGQWNYSEAYTDLVFLTGGTEAVVPLPDIPNCSPACAEIIACGGGCLLVDLDTPVAMPAAGAIITGGLAPHINPSVIDLCATPAANIHMLAQVDMLVNIYYWGNCC